MQSESIRLLPGKLYLQVASVCKATAIIGAIWCWASNLVAHEDHHGGDEVTGIVAEWNFRPDYTLTGSASNKLGTPFPLARTKVLDVQRATLPVLMRGEEPTERIRNLLKLEEIPHHKFSVEAWYNNHVNRPVGFAVIADGPQQPRENGWSFLAFSTDERTEQIQLRLATGEDDHPVIVECQQPSGEGFLEYWWHVVGTFDGNKARLYVNGDLQEEVAVPTEALRFGHEGDFEIAGYLNSEPEMQLANLVQQIRLYDKPLSASEVAERTRELQHLVKRGVVYPGTFHFTAGPYLNYATQNGMNVLWETNRPASCRIEWGRTADLGESAELPISEYTIHEYRIEGLEPHTSYFYRVSAVDKKGESIDSGILTFQTAVHPDEPFRFAVIGDTETRPHINHKLCELVWAERPNFVVNLGDLTDGGMQDRKFQWNLEYFTGISGLGSRVPFFPVPGNGEGDLYWYKKYHVLPEDESPYSFTYGNAEFFMLDSNLKRTEFAEGGRQHQWLQNRLEDSKARWKFACFHHAPYTSEEDDYGNSWVGPSTHGDPEIRPLVPLFEKYGVDVVMFGHLHLYERSWPLKRNRVGENGVVYLLAGGGGGNLEDFAPNAAFFSARAFRGHHYCLVSIRDNQLTLSMHDLSGAMRDSFQLEKPQTTSALDSFSRTSQIEK